MASEFQWLTFNPFLQPHRAFQLANGPSSHADRTQKTAPILMKLQMKGLRTIKLNKLHKLIAFTS